MDRNRVAAILRSFKNGWVPGSTEYLLPVSHNGELILRLRPLQAASEAIPEEDVLLLTDWRNRHRNAFFTSFTATPDRTRRWLCASVGANDLRIMFMLETIDGEPIGHIGLCNFDCEAGACEIDNILRGHGAVKGAMTSAIRALCAWVFDELKLASVYLRVFADNEPAIRLYRRCGFEEVTLVPMKHIVGSVQTQWVELDGPVIRTAERYALLMVRQAGISGS